MVSLAGSQVPWIPCSCIRPLMSHYDLFSSSSFMATICQGWSVQVSSAKSTLSYTRQLPSEGGAKMQSHLPTLPTGVATSPSSAWLGRRAFKATASWKWCCDVPSWLVPLIGWNIWNILVQLDGLFCFIYPNGEVVFFKYQYHVRIPWSHQLHSRKPT